MMQRLAALVIRPRLHLICCRRMLAPDAKLLSRGVTAKSIRVRDSLSEKEFVKMCQARDATLDVSTLILLPTQVNMAGSQLPSAEGDGISYLQIPLTALGKPDQGGNAA